MPFPYKAVIFDMDGVITDTMPFHFRAWRQVFKENGLHVPAFEVYRREGQKGIDSVIEIFATQGRLITRKQAQAVLVRKEEVFKGISRVRFVPGSRGFLKWLNNQNIPLALVTGTSYDEVRHVLPCWIFESFSVIVSGSDVKNGKPHPEPYRKAVKALRIRPAEGIVIENAPFGIQSAKAAGLCCMAVETSLPKKFLRQADRSFPSITSLRRYIEDKL